MRSNLRWPKLLVITNDFMFAVGVKNMSDLIERLPI